MIHRKIRRLIGTKINFFKCCINKKNNFEFNYCDRFSTLSSELYRNVKQVIDE